MNKNDRIYQERFGDIPNDLEKRLDYILGKKKDNEKYRNDILKELKKIKRIKKKVLEFTLWSIVKPSARPRVNTRGYLNIYVPRAAENKKWFTKFAEEKKLPCINTPCELILKIYEKTPSNFSIKKKILAETGYIKPWKRTGDFDNYAKSIADAMQPSVLEDDCLIVKSEIDLLYSIKPHVDVKIIYLEKFPDI